MRINKPLLYITLLLSQPFLLAQNEECNDREEELNLLNTESSTPLMMMRASEKGADARKVNRDFRNDASLRADVDGSSQVKRGTLNAYPIVEKNPPGNESLPKRITPTPSAPPAAVEKTGAFQGTSLQQAPYLSKSMFSWGTKTGKANSDQGVIPEATSVDIIPEAEPVDGFFIDHLEVEAEQYEGADSTELEQRANLANEGSREKNLLTKAIYYKGLNQKYTNTAQPYSLNTDSSNQSDLQEEKVQKNQMLARLYKILLAKSEKQLPSQAPSLSESERCSMLCQHSELAVKHALLAADELENSNCQLCYNPFFPQPPNVKADMHEQLMKLHIAIIENIKNRNNGNLKTSLLGVAYANLALKKEAQENSQQASPEQKIAPRYYEIASKLLTLTTMNRSVSGIQESDLASETREIPRDAQRDKLFYSTVTGAFKKGFSHPYTATKLPGNATPHLQRLHSKEQNYLKQYERVDAQKNQNSQNSALRNEIKKTRALFSHATFYAQDAFKQGATPSLKSQILENLSDLYAEAAINNESGNQGVISECANAIAFEKLALANTNPEAALLLHDIAIAFSKLAGLKQPTKPASACTIS